MAHSGWTPPCLKVRQGGRIVPVAAMIAVAADTERRREIIGRGIGPSQAGAFRTGILRSLRARSLDGVRPVISSRRRNGPPNRLVSRLDLYRPEGRHLPGLRGTWQRCRVTG